jgi:glycosyltransferase involved in cell wall biosynthesis
LRTIVRNAYFVIVPSEWYENNPMTIIEAYSASTPVIGSKIGGIPEIVEDRKTGFLFSCGNEVELTDIIKLASDLNKEEYQEMRVNSLFFAKEHFDRETYCHKLIGFYKEFIKI